MFHFYTPWKRQKTSGILTFSGGIELEHWFKMDLRRLAGRIEAWSIYVWMASFNAV